MLLYTLLDIILFVIFSHVTKPYYRTSKLPVRRPISSNIRSFFINSFIVRDISQYFVDATVQVRFNAQHAKNKPIVITERTAEKWLKCYTRYKDAALRKYQVYIEIYIYKKPTYLVTNKTVQDDLYTHTSVAQYCI